MVYRDGKALGLAHEIMGGDTSFENTITIEHQQIFRHLDYYLKGENPSPFSCEVDDILHGQRNAWLPVLHITVEADWSAFVEDVRSARDKAASDFAPLYNRWALEKPTFNKALKNELGALASGYVDAYFHFLAMAEAGEASGDVRKYMNGALSPVVTLIHEINSVFVEHGTP